MSTRRSFLKLIGVGTAAAAVGPVSIAAPKVTPKMVVTYVTIRGEGEFPFTEASYVMHREDLSDLREPYLSAVREARRNRRAA